MKFKRISSWSISFRGYQSFNWKTRKQKQIEFLLWRLRAKQREQLVFLHNCNIWLILPVLYPSKMKLRTAHYNSYNLFDEIRTRISLRMSKLILDGKRPQSSVFLREHNLLRRGGSFGPFNILPLLCEWGWIICQENCRNRKIFTSHH